MPNINFADSVLPNAILRMSDIFSGTNTRYANYLNTKSLFAATINQRQSARFNEVMSGNRCLGVEITWLKDCTPLGDYDCKTASEAIDGCGVPTGNSIQSDKKLYDPKCVIDHAMKLNDGLCNNQYTAEELFSETLARIVTELDIKMNRYVIAQIMAKAQVNIASDPIGTVDGTITNIQSSYWTEDLLVQLEVEAMENGLNNYVIFDGQNFVTQRALSQYRSLNANEANKEATFRAYDSRLIFDNPIDIKAVTGRKSSFFVDLDMLAFVNRTKYTSPTPVLADPQNNIYHFYVTSPRTGIRYDFEYQKVCTGRNDILGKEFDHKLWGYFVGGVEFAPEQCDGGTGILEYVKVA